MFFERNFSVMKFWEIGSEFHIDLEKSAISLNKSNIFDYLQEYNTQYFDSGRSALLELLKQIHVKKIALPEYICESVRNCFNDVEVVYYTVDQQFHIIWDDLIDICNNSNVDTIYLHYFNGYIDESYDFVRLNKLKEKKNIQIIEDTTHSFFSNKHTIGDYCICSLRKWFAIPDGGVLYSKKKFKKEILKVNNWYELKYEAMIKKNNYLKGLCDNKSEFLNTFSKVENMLDNQKESFRISEISLNILKTIDLKNIMQKRVDNYIILGKAFEDNGYKLIALEGINQVPLFCTIYVDRRDDMRNYLIKNNIYCPVHWPLYNELQKRKNAIHNTMHELSIPIDQRYSENEMSYIINKVKKYHEIKNVRQNR